MRRTRSSYRLQPERTLRGSTVGVPHAKVARVRSYLNVLGCRRWDDPRNGCVPVGSVRRELRVKRTRLVCKHGHREGRELQNLGTGTCEGSAAGKRSCTAIASVNDSAIVTQ